LGLDWKNALQTQLSSLIREAWLDYQSNPDFREAWASIVRFSAAGLKRAGRDPATAPVTADDFTFDLLMEIVWLSGVFGILRYESIVDTLALAFASVASVEIAHAKVLVETGKGNHEVDLVRGIQEIISLGLSEAHLRPILSILVICAVAIDEEGQQDFSAKLREFLSYLLGDSYQDKDAPSRLFDLVCEICEYAESLDDGLNLSRVLRSALLEEDRGGTLDSDESALNVPALDSEYANVISELTGMIGLEAVKKEVTSLANFIKVRRLREAKGLKVSPISLHLVFTGNPGTGKTTVARLVAKLFNSLGVLSRDNLVEVDRGGLVAGYIGHTAIKTKAVVESAFDGVLFIDEAYSLVKDSTWDFGPEAIETLLKLMEDNRHRLVVIVAGYPDKMREFIESNPGLKSRFQRTIHFEDYSADEMLRIFEQYAISSDFSLDPNAWQPLLAHFREKEGGSDYGNGRGVRNDFEAAVVRHADRLANIRVPSDKDLTVLMKADVVSGPDDVCANDELEEREPAFDPNYLSHFWIGTRVSHLKFGDGDVTAVDGNKLSIQFDRIGAKRVDESFVERLDDSLCGRPVWLVDRLRKLSD
jgi:hypothetical protein